MIRLLAVIPFVVGLVGCGGLGQLIPSSGAASRDICPLLTVGEIDRLWGWPGTRPESEQSQKGPTCGYRDTGSGAETVMRLYLSSVAACEEARGFEGSSEIAGIGDWAYWSEDRGQMYVRKGDSCLEVIGNTPGDVDIDYMTNLTELTRIAVGRL